MKIMVDQETLVPYLMMTMKTRKTAPARTRAIAASTGRSPGEPLMNSLISSKKTFRTMRGAICGMMTRKWLDQSVQALWERRMLQALMKLRWRI